MSSPAKEKVIFPPVNAETEAKLRGLLRSVGEFMNIELKPEVQTVLMVSIPPDRFDIYTVLNKISLQITINNKSKIANNKPAK